MTRERLLAATLLELADTITDDFEALDLLHHLADRVAELLGAVAVGVVLADQRGALHLVASSSHDPQLLALETTASRAGPCLDAFRSGQPVVGVVGDEARRRWPDFVAAAEACGVRGAHALPLRVRREVLGALSLFFEAPDELSDEERWIGEALAGVAMIGLLQERTDRRKELIAEQLQAALTLRVLVEQAKGIVAEHAGCSIDEAFVRISVHARRSGEPLTRVAAGLVDGTVAWEDLGGQIS